MQQHISGYVARLSGAMQLAAMQKVQNLAEVLRSAWSEHRTIFLCGNGGSAGNAVHIANDWLIGAALSRAGPVPDPFRD